MAVFAKKKNLRLLLTGGLPDPRAPGVTVQARSPAACWSQSRDNAPHHGRRPQGRHQARSPTEAEMRDMLFAFTVAKHVKSNAIVYAKDGATAGIGAGQMSRRDSARIAAARPRTPPRLRAWRAATIGSACASDAFFPFADGLIAAADAGATAVIQPGGSHGDEVIEPPTSRAGHGLHRRAGVPRTDRAWAVQDTVLRSAPAHQRRAGPEQSIRPKGRGSHRPLLPGWRRRSPGARSGAPRLHGSREGGADGGEAEQRQAVEGEAVHSSGLPQGGLVEVDLSCRH